MSITVLGAGAFGTALAIALGQDEDVTLWARDQDHTAEMAKQRENTRRLPGAPFPDKLRIARDLSAACSAEVILLAVPMQKLRGFLTEHKSLLQRKPLVACCKGMEIGTGMGPLSVIRDEIKETEPAILTGPSFADEIAKGLPTALTLACTNGELCSELQAQLSTPTLRLYRSTDTIGAELGGALKNVIAIACGAVMGAGLGESARAALMTRGYAEMQRLARAQGAQPDTLAGLSGFGDLALTCASPLSRNFCLGLALGRNEPFDPSITVEGAATAQAVTAASDLDLPITQTVTNLVAGDLTIDQAVDQLLKRPLKEE